MPLKEPGNLREKLYIIAYAGAGKTSAYLSIAWWAYQSGDTRKFYILDTDDEAVQHVLNEPKFDGMVHTLNGALVNEGGNLHITSAYSWQDYLDFSAKAVANTQFGDFIIVDFVSHAWNEAQNDFLLDAAKKTKDRVMVDAGKEGLSGWDMYKTDFNWQAINGNYFTFIKPILLTSRAHVVMTAEEEEIQEGRNMSAYDKEHLAQFGKWKGAGVQKKIPYQCRTYLRIQRLARGRVLYTQKDRARPELNADDMKPDFFTAYLKGVAGWSVVE